MKNATIIKKINDLFPVQGEDKPIAFESNGQIVVSAETDCFLDRIEDMDIYLPVADYYGEFRGCYPWIDKRLVKLLSDNHFIISWYDGGTLQVSRL